MPWSPKDPADTDVFAFDFSGWLPSAPVADTITGAPTITVSPAGMSIGNVVLVGSTVWAWLSGGNPGTTYRVTCTIKTQQGRSISRSETLLVTPR
jgi:hypothetical protein